MADHKFATLMMAKIIQSNLAKHTFLLEQKSKTKENNEQLLKFRKIEHFLEKTICFSTSANERDI